MSALLAALSREHGDQLESLPSRLGWPFVPEHDLWFRRRLRAPELRAALAQAETAAAKGGAEALAARGRLRRLLGADAAAAADFRAALDRAPGLGEARAWLAELDLSRPEALAELDRAVEAGAADAPVLRAVARLLRGRAAEALEDARAAVRARPRAALPRLLEGEALHRLRRFADAERAFLSAARAEPGCAAAWLLAARAAARGLPAVLPPRAERHLHGALNADPSYGFMALSYGAAKAGSGARWRRLLGRMLRFAFEQPGKAGWYYRLDDIHYAPFHFQEYADAKAVRAAHPEAAWANALVVRGVLRCPPDAARAAEGFAAIRRAIAKAPWAGWMRAWRALALARAGRREEAERELDASLRLQPLYHRAHAWRGNVRRLLGRPREALDDLDREVSIDEQCPYSAHERSLCRRRLGDWEGAALDLDRAFALEPRYAWAFASGRDPERAELERGERELAAALARSPSRVSLRAWRGDLRRAAGDLSGALADLRAAAAEDPLHANAQAFLGRALLAAGRPEEAAGPLALSVELAPRRWIFRGWLAEAEFRAGRPARAWRLIDEIVAGTPLHWWALHLRAELRLEAGDVRAALADLAKADEFEGKHSEGAFLEARARLALGELGAAEDAADRALALSPNFGKALLLRAEIRRARGRAEQAVGDYRAVYERFPYLFNDEERGRVAALLEAA